jgi:hypothetical protein
MQSNLFDSSSVPSGPPVIRQTTQIPPPQQYQPQVQQQPTNTRVAGGGSQYASSIRRTEIPALSPFPELSFTVTKISEGFDFGLKPRTPINDRPIRRLNFTPGNQLKEMRNELARDLSDFSCRMKRLGTAQPLEMETVKFPDRTDAPVAAKQQRKAPTQKKVALQESDEQPNFTTESQFLLPDGSPFA